MEAFEFKSGGSFILDTYSKSVLDISSNNCDNAKAIGTWKKLSEGNYDLVKNSEKEKQTGRVIFEGNNKIIFEEKEKDAGKITFERL